MPLLLEACPSFSSAWAEIESDGIHVGDDGDRLAYLDAGEFIAHLVRLRLAGDTAEFHAVFDVIERLHVEGDSYVRELATIGYLEGFQMQTVTAHGLNPESDFRPYLRPVSEQWWQRVNEFWAGDTTALTERDDT